MTSSMRPVALVVANIWVPLNTTKAKGRYYTHVPPQPNETPNAQSVQHSKTDIPIRVLIWTPKNLTHHLRMVLTLFGMVCLNDPLRWEREREGEREVEGEEEYWKGATTRQKTPGII